MGAIVGVFLVICVIVIAVFYACWFAEEARIQREEENWWG